MKRGRPRKHEFDAQNFVCQNEECNAITSDGNDDYTDAIRSAYGDLNSGTGELEMRAGRIYYMGS